MKASLIVYSWVQEPQGLTSFRHYLREASLRFYASEALHSMGYFTGDEFEEALHRTLSILTAADLPIQNHIRRTFRSEGDQIYQDWKLSSLALHVLKINGDPKNGQVAHYQLKTYSLMSQHLNQEI